jgi:hypothetical protein
MPELELRGSSFVANGEEVVLKGVVLPRFVIKHSSNDYRRTERLFKNEVDALKRMGANFIAAEWNAGNEYLGYPHYVESLIRSLEYAKSKGFWVELVLHSRGADPKTDWGYLQINTLDQRVVEDWKKLLSDPETAKRLSKTVDIWGVLAEARLDANGSAPSIFDPVLDAAIEVIRSRIGDSDAICFVSGREWGGDASELLGTAPARNNVVVEVHPYYWIGGKTGFQDYAPKLRDAGYNVLVGEIGVLYYGKDKDYTAEEKYVRDMVDFLNKNGLSFAFFGIDAESDDPYHVWNRSGITDIGNYVQKYFK